MGEYKMPTKIFFGPQSLECLNGFAMKSVLIVCDPFMKQSKKVELITEILKKKQIPYSVFSDVVPDPTIEVVCKGIAEAWIDMPDTIIALGGGSAIDTAKAVRLVYVNLTNTVKPTLIAIPTTSGTGSEVTSFAVISDPSKQMKYALVNQKVLPDIAILDPGFTTSVPPKVTADTGMDVLTHALEAFVSNAASDFTDACAEKALKIVWDYLEKAQKNGQNLEAREKMHNASCLAGMAFSEASLGITHSLAHALGGYFHIPHGRAIAMILPHVIHYNAALDEPVETLALARYVKAANLLGICCGTSKATVHRLIITLQHLMKSMGMPATIAETGILPDEFSAAIPEMAANALTDRCTRSNPRQPSKEDLEQLYRKLCKGGC